MRACVQKRVLTVIIVCPGELLAFHLLQTPSPHYLLSFCKMCHTEVWSMFNTQKASKAPTHHRKKAALVHLQKQEHSSLSG